MEIKKNDKQKSPVRSDNRRMTGNVNIYICSETIEKGKKPTELDADEILKSDSAVSVVPETPRVQNNQKNTHTGNMILYINARYLYDTLLFRS